MLAAAAAAGPGGSGRGADEGGSLRAAAGEGAWPSQRGGRSLQLRLVFPLVQYNHRGLGCAVEGHPLQLRGPELVPAAAVAVTVGAAAAAAAVAAAAEVAAAGTRSSC